MDLLWQSNVLMVDKSTLRLSIIALTPALLLLLSWKHEFLFFKELISAGVILSFVLVHKLIDQKVAKETSESKKRYPTNNPGPGVFTIIRNGDEKR